MIEPVSGLTRLRQATQDIHADFENRLKIAQPDAGKHDYRVFIEAMWGWLSPFEDALWSAQWPAELQAQERNGKRAWLLNDLRGAGLGEEQVAALPLAPCTLDLDSPASRFGIAYVLEGAQLGSQVLLRRIGSVLAPWPTRWLTGYGEACGANWRQFMQSANRYLAEEEAARDAANAARATFLSLQSWFMQRGAA